MLLLILYITQSLISDQLKTQFINKQINQHELAFTDNFVYIIKNIVI